MNKQHTLYQERFRPNELENYLGSPELLDEAKKWLNNNDIPHLIFAGSAGLGKSTLARLLANKINCDSLIIKTSDENGIDTIREKVKSFASAASFSPLKIIIMEEAANLTNAAQEALKEIVEDYSMTTRFIFTTNHLGKIVEPLRSRCEVWNFKGVSKGEIAKHIVTYILEPENIEYDITDVVALINANYPDIRSTVKYLQKCVNDNKFKFVPINDDLSKNVLTILKKPSSKAWSEIRQLVVDSGNDDYQFLIEFLFEHLDEFAKGKEAEIVIELDDSQWRSKVVPDKEINIAALFAKILNILK